MNYDDIDNIDGYVVVVAAADNHNNFKILHFSCHSTLFRKVSNILIFQ